MPTRGQVYRVFVKWRLRRGFGVKFLAVSARAIGSARRPSSFPAERLHNDAAGRDEMAFLLTGYRKFYQGKPHSTSWTTPATPPPNDPE